jgi:hypothetical protein
MKITQEITDKLSIGLSMLCAIHCLVLPLLLVALPSFGALQLQNENFHTWMLISVIPISIYALTMGCKKHKRYRLFLLGGAGLVLMVVAVLFGHDIGGELGEKTLTLLGAVLIVIAHFRNFRLCRKHNDCACSD